MDPDEDPLGSLLSIDYYSLRAKELPWFQRLHLELGDEKGFKFLPNMAYSAALVQWQIEDAEGQVCKIANMLQLSRSQIFYCGQRITRKVRAYCRQQLPTSRRQSQRCMTNARRPILQSSGTASLPSEGEFASNDLELLGFLP